MTFMETVLAGLGTACSLTLGLIVYIFSGLVKRTDAVEAELKNKVDREELMTLLNLRLSALTDDIKDIKDLMKLLMEIRLQKHVKRSKKPRG